MSTSINRRQFITASSAVGLALAADSQPVQAQAKQYQGGTSRWPLCLNMSTIRPATPEDKVRCAIEAGYDAVELWMDDIEKYEAAGGSLKDMGAKLRDHGLFVIDVIGLWDCLPPTKEEWEAMLPKTRDRMRMAAAVGSKHVAALPLPDRDNFDIRWATDRYRDLLNMGRSDYGILPAFEFVSLFRTVPRMGTAAGIAIDANDPDAKIIADTFHMHKGGSGFEGVRHMNGGFIASFHWNDVPAEPTPEQMGDKDRILPGDGVLPLKNVLKQLVEINYTGPLSLELFNRELWQRDPLEVAKLGLEKMRAQVADFS